MSFHFFVKSNLEFGAGSASVLPELIRKHDLKKVMVIYDGGVKAAGIAEKVLAEVKKAEVPYVIFDEVRKRRRWTVLWQSAAEAASIPRRPSTF